MNAAHTAASRTIPPCAFGADARLEPTYDPLAIGTTHHRQGVHGARRYPDGRRRYRSQGYGRTDQGGRTRAHHRGPVSRSAAQHGASLMALIEHAPHQLPALPSEQEAALSYKLSSNAASLCREVVKNTAMKIQGRKYVRAEGWLSIAVAHGCVVSVRDVEQIDGGIRAIAELRRLADQSLIATAEGFVGDDEPLWAKRPMYARRAMAQTRASSRVCRTVFAHVVVMIDASLGTTPAEEMMGIEVN